MMYLGVLGRMIGIKCPTAQQVTGLDRYSFSTTLGGEVKAQAGPLGRRVWDVSLGRLSTPSDVGTLMDFVNGSWGPGPFWFVAADAPVVNMLTPNAAACLPSEIEESDTAEYLGGPPMNLDHGAVAARSVWKSPAGHTAFGGPVPVIPGTHVTGSAWVVGDGRVRLTFLDSTGGQVSVIQSAVVGGATPERLAVTSLVPATAVSVRLWVTTGVTQAARPAITWTDQVYEWGDGQGCEKAIVHSTQRDVTKAWQNPDTGRWSDLSFRVNEVG